MISLYVVILFKTMWLCLTLMLATIMGEEEIRILYVSMLFKMKAIDYYMHWLPQISCYLYIYKMPIHRKRVRLKS